MDKAKRIKLLTTLGKQLLAFDEAMMSVIHRSYLQNPWFTKENSQNAIRAIGENLLNEQQLTTWLDAYEIADIPTQKRVGIVMAGNIPLVGFHDLLCVFAAGHQAAIKLSDKDPYFIPHLLKRMEDIDPVSKSYFTIIERLKDFDAVIATGSNNTARYFESYFGKYPHIIRRNRNAIAVLDGTESEIELKALGQDIFQYFGLGCRNVSKLYLPKDYAFEPLLEALHTYNDIIHHHKYKNNFDYNFTLLILNNITYKANSCILMSENEAFQSRIATLHYEYYDALDELEKQLKSQQDAIQCIVSKQRLQSLPTLDFGQAQSPGLCDYADGVDTMAFLKELV